MNIYDYLTKDYKPDMGMRIRSCRLQSKLTQEKMAEILDISVKHYGEVERGVTGLSIEKLLFLSDFFHVSLDYLLKGENQSEPFPFVFYESYRICPEDKKDALIDLIKNLNTILTDTN